MDLQNPEPEDLLCEESFLRFCKGENSADIIFWQHWIKMHPEKQSVAESAQRLYDILSAGQGNRLEQLTALKDAIARREQFAALISSHKPKKVFHIRRYAAAAAAVTLLITGAYAWMKYSQKETWTVTRFEYATAQNGHQTIMLPDSSVVMLNGNSRITISKDYREVTLTGEAFFDIKHDAAHPFVVHTNDYKVRVLGTSFNVRAYPGTKTETDLITGKVEIVPVASERVTLQPNQKFILEHNLAVPGKAVKPDIKRTVASLHVDSLTRHVTETAWARTKIEINNETLEQIAVKLQAWYGINISFASEEVKNYRYTASFDDETIFKVLQYLQQSYPFTYNVEQDSIIISRS